MASPLTTLFDCSVADILAALPEESDPVWDVYSARQKAYDVHNATRTIAFKRLAALDDAPAEPSVATLLYAPEALAAPVLACGERLAAHYGGTAVTLLLTELKPGQSIGAHRDNGEVLKRTHRCHVPILTNDAVDFMIDGRNYHFDAGKAYEMDNMRLHSVANRGTERRIHLICNVLPAGG